MREELIEILAEYKDMNPSEVVTDLPFTEMGLDSLDVAELVMVIEQEYGVTVELSAELNTLDKVVEYLEKRMG